MPISFLTSTKRAGSGVTPAIDTSAANLLVAVVSGWESAAPTISDSKSNTWTLIADHNSGGCRQRMWYCVSPTVGSGHTFTVGGGYPSGYVAAYNGLKASGALESHATSGQGGTTHSHGAAAPSSEPALMCCGVDFYPSSPQSIDSGYSIRESQTYQGGANMGGGLADKIKSELGSETPQWSFAGSNSACSGIHAVFLAPPPGSVLSLVHCMNMLRIITRRPIYER